MGGKQTVAEEGCWLGQQAEGATHPARPITSWPDQG